MDTMDSSYPTKLARCGTLMTKNGLIRIKQGKHSQSHGMRVDEDCECTTCTHYDRAYLCHLFKANEPVALQIATIHNIHFMNKLMSNLRQRILSGIL